jgi:hypothetical protein
LAVFVITGVVVDQDRSPPPVTPRQLLQECQIAGGIEDFVAAVVKTGTPQFHRAQNLHAMALAGDRNQQRAADPSPTGVQRGVLAKAGFVGEDQRPSERLGFFLMLG